MPAGSRGAWPRRAGGVCPGTPRPGSRHRPPDTACRVVQPPPLTPVPSPGRVWLRSHLRAAFPDLPLPCVRPLSLMVRMPCEMTPCSPGEWGNIRAALHARTPVDECGGKALPLSGPAPGQSFDPSTALTWPSLGVRPSSGLPSWGDHRGRGSQEQSWKSSSAELGASAFEGPGNQPWVNRSQTWLMHLMTQ